MYKILILAYLIGQSPVDTQRTFQMEQTFDTMTECKAELLKKDPVRDTYDVLRFVNRHGHKYVMPLTVTKNDETAGEFQMEPSYPKDKPEELQDLGVQ